VDIDINLYSNEIEGASRLLIGGIIGRISWHTAWPTNSLYTGNIGGNSSSIMMGPIFGGETSRDYDLVQDIATMSFIWEGDPNLTMTSYYNNYNVKGRNFTSTKISGATENNSNYRIETNQYSYGYLAGVNKGIYTNELSTTILNMFNTNATNLGLSKWTYSNGTYNLQQGLDLTVTENSSDLYTFTITPQSTIQNATYSYKWYINDNLDNSITTNSYSFKPSFSTSRKIQVLVSDGTYVSLAQFTLEKLTLGLNIYENNGTLVSQLTGTGVSLVSFDDYDINWYEIDIVEGKTESISNEKNLSNAKRYHEYQLELTNGYEGAETLTATYQYDQRNIVFVNNTSYRINNTTYTGNNNNSGNSPESAVKTLERAYQLLNGSGTVESNVIVVMGNYTATDYLDVRGGNQASYNTAANRFTKSTLVTGKYKGTNYSGNINFSCQDNAYNGKYLFADTRFEYIVFNGNRGSTFFYLQGHDITLGSGIVMTNYEQMDISDFGHVKGLNTPRFSMFCGFHNYNYASIPNESKICNVVIRSGTYGRVVSGGRNNSGAESILQTSHNIFGSLNDYFTTNIDVDFINQTTSDTPDINLLVAGATDGNIFINSTVNVKSGKIARILGGNIGSNSIMLSGYPINLFVGSTTMNITGGDISEIYGTSLGRWTDVIYYYGKVQINISGGIIRNAIYGAGAASVTGNNSNFAYEYYSRYASGVDTSVEINISGGDIIGNVYGGGYGYSSYLTTSVRNDGGALYGNSTINITGGNLSGNIFGAGRGYNYTNKTNLAQMIGNSTINVSGNPVITGNIYGAGEGISGSNGIAKLIGNSTINIDANINSNIYGGGSVANITGNTNINVNGGNAAGTIYGGGRQGNVEGISNVIINNGTVSQVFGGGHEAGLNESFVNLKGGSISKLFGGCNISGNVNKTNVVLENGEATEIYGGNNEGGNSPNTNVYVYGGKLDNIYGGGNKVFVDETNVYLRNSTEKVGNVYGGGNNAGANKTNVYVQGGEALNMYGGSNNSGNVSETKVYVGNENDVENNPEGDDSGGNSEGGSGNGEGNGSGQPDVEEPEEEVIEPKDGYAAYMNKTYYTTVQSAIDAAGNTEQKITMISNTTETIQIQAEKNIILDLNGYTLTSSNTTITLYGSLTVNDSSELGTGKISTTGSSNSYYPILQYGGTFVLNKGDITSNYRGIRTYNNATVIINGGSVTANSGSGIGFESDGYFEMNGGRVQASSHGFYTANSVNMLITAGSITGGTTGVFSSGQSVITIGKKDGKSSEEPIITGATGLNASNCTINIYDGILRGTSSAVNGGVGNTEDGFDVQYTGETINGTYYNIVKVVERNAGGSGGSGGNTDNPGTTNPNPPEEEEPEVETPSIEIDLPIANFIRIDNIYGGNNAGGTTTTSNIISYSGNVANIYGGGNRVNGSTTNVEILGGTIENIYGGSNQTGNINNANILINGGTTTNVYGGNNAGGTTENSNVIVNKGTVENTYGGNNQGGTTNNAKTQINGGKVTNVFGGGNQAETNSTQLNVNAEVLGSVYGGGNQAGVNTNTNVKLLNAVVTVNVYGGGNEGVVLGNTYVVVTDSQVLGSVYAGGNGTTAIVLGNTNLLVEGNTNIKKHAFGGGNQAATGLENEKNSVSTVNVVGGNIEGNVYGGANTSVVYGVTKVNIGKSVSNIENYKKADLSILGTVFGGGEANEAGDENYDFSFISVTDGIEINIDADSYSTFVIGKSIFGSGNASTTTGTSIININNYGTYNSPKSNISIQRANKVILNNSSMWLAGATDRTNEHSNVLFSLSRIDELKLKNNSNLFMQNGANLVKKLYSIADNGNGEEKGFVKINEDGTIKKNVDNRIYMREGANLNIAENEQTTAYGEVHGMFFLGLYTGKNQVNIGIYSKEYEHGDEVDNDDRLIFTKNSYVLGEHYESHDITVDGFYSNFKTEENIINVNYIEPTPTDQIYYIWSIGEAADAVIYEIDLTASKYNTLGTKELQLLGFGKPNTVFEYAGSSCDLVEGIKLVDKNEIKNIEENQEVADSNFGLGIETGRNGWNMEGKTRFLSEEPHYIGTTTYLSENSAVTPSFNFYLYHSQNISVEQELGTVVISFVAIEQEDELNKTMRNILIYVNMDTALYQDSFYESSLTPGEKYELFTNTQTNITSESEFSQYYSLVIDEFSTTDYYKYHNKSHRTLVSSRVLPANTTITMIDMMVNSTEYYYYVVTAEDEAAGKKTFDIVNFKRMGSTEEYFVENNARYYNSDLDIEHEEFIFHFDFSNANITNPIVNETIFLEYRTDENETLIGVLGDLREDLEYSIYVTGSNISVNATTSKPSVYLGEELYLKVETNYNQTVIDNKVIYDTNYFGQKSGIKITFYDSKGEQVNGSSLLGVHFELNGVNYYPRVDGTTRINTAENVSNIKSNIKVVTDNSNLASGNYTIKIEAFSSPDGIYYGLESADEVSLQLLILNSIYGLKVDLEDNMVIVNSEKGLTQNDDNKLKFNIEFTSGLIKPNIKVGLYRRDYSNIYSNSYNLVNLQDYVENELTLTNINDIYLVTSSPSEKFDFDLGLKDKLVTGTYKVVFSLYDDDVYIGEVYKYIVIN